MDQQQQQQQQQQPGSSTSILTGVSTIASSVIVQQQSVQEEPTNLPSSVAVAVAESQRSVSGAPSATPSPVLSPPGKIFGRNANGTMVATSTPSNEAELQLYRVLQRASLLSYYDTLLEMGGDDVQQLCDAGEEEFLEIMALVGMASKPLHVRRLQKALHEWVNNPSAFQTPLPSAGFPEPSQFMYAAEPSTSRSKFTISPGFTPTPLMSTTPTVTHTPSGLTPLTPPTGGVTSQVTSSSPQLTPSLTEAQIARLSMGAEKLARQLPQREPRPQSSKKRTSRELEQVMAMSENDPRRMDEIRKYAAIYGRFDCKRRPEKPLTLHEVCVNEAAAQICKFVPALLTRRDELFPLARQLVKDSGFGHSASIARYGLLQQAPKSDDSESTGAVAKRTRLSSTETTTTTTTTTAEYTKDLLEESRLNLFAMYQKFGRPFDLSDITKFSLSRSDYEDNDNDSRFSFSNSSSPPPLQHLNGSEAESQQNAVRSSAGEDNGGISGDNNCDKDESVPKSPNNRIGIEHNIPSSPLGVQVISASGGHIIAVANPALAMSPALNETLNIKREASSPDL